MSMLDSFFNKGFKGPKCKTLLKLTIPRIKLLRNKREIQLRQMRRDIAKLLETGQEATARIRVEHIIREENMIAAQEIIELFCELISVRIPIIETQRECPLDLKEAISSVCFAAPRCADLQELMHVQMLFVSKYGKEFVAAATELRPDCGVNRQLIELLSVHAPAPEKKLKLLTEIAEEHGLDWDPTSSENEMFKPHEDLLNGPSQLASESVSDLPPPKEKVLTMEHFPSESLNADSDSDGLEFPEVPKISERAKVTEPVVPPAIPPVTFTDDDESSEEEADESTQNQSDRKQEETTLTDTGNRTDELLNEVKAVNDVQYQSYVPPPVLSSPSYSSENGKTFPSISKHSGDVNVDLQDVLAAAQAAADSAERAASAARSAANLVHLRVTELVQKKNEEVTESIPSFSSRDEVAHELFTTEKANFDHQHSFDDSHVSISPPTHKHPWEHQKMDSDILRDHIPEVNFDSYGSFGNGSQSELTRNHVEEMKFDSYDSFGNSSQPELTRNHVEEMKFDSYDSFGNSSQPEPTRDQPQRSTSMDDDPYFSYLDFFTSKRDSDEAGDNSVDTKSGSL